MDETVLDECSRDALLALVRELRAAVTAAQEQGRTFAAALAVAHAKIVDLESELEALRQQGGRGGGPVKTPANSSVPSGKSWKAQRREPEPGSTPATRGPKVGHPGVSRERVPPEQVDQVVACWPAQCRSCGSVLREAGGTVVGRRQVVDLPPIQPVVTEAQLVAVHCPACQEVTVGAYPPGFGATGVFGPRVTALAALLHEEHHVAYARLVDLFGGVFGLQVSEGALVAAVGRLGEALRPAAEAIGEEVRTSPVVGSDETGARVDGATWWEWVFGTPTAAYHAIVRRRNTEVVLSFLDGATPAVWVSDLWKPQLAAPAVRYQICLAHQLRDLRYAADAGTGVPRTWANELAALLRRAIHRRNEHVAGRRDAAAFAEEVATITTACDNLLGQRLPWSMSQDLQRRFVVHRRGLLTFLDDLTVPPTNNASERSLRPSVVHRKVTGGFRSHTWARGYAALRTVTDTARKRGQDVFTLLLQTAQAPPLPPTPDAPLPV